jgi:hypothetical protein
MKILCGRISPILEYGGDISFLAEIRAKRRYQS